MTGERMRAFVDSLLAGKSPEEQIAILRHCLEQHVFQHPWADDEIVGSMIHNIFSEYRPGFVFQEDELEMIDPDDEDDV